MGRETLLHRVRTALGRSVDQPPAPVPPARIRIPEIGLDARIERLLSNVAALAGKTHRAATPAGARAYVSAVLEGRRAVASNARYLGECGITGLANVTSGLTDRTQLRELCATLDVGITSADYALADTGTLVLLSSPEEARMISLLPPAHIAVVPASRVLTGLDELFSLIPMPADRSSSMVLITGPSRTADIEQRLVRGVHGPGELHVVAVG
ncbi:MAG: lactate utilization protein C [Bryobacteraceae bacterium]